MHCISSQQIFKEMVQNFSVHLKFVVISLYVRRFEYLKKVEGRERLQTEMKKEIVCLIPYHLKLFQ